MPCPLCTAFERNAAALHGRRLYAHDRHWLLTAAPHGSAEGTPILATQSTPSGEVMTRSSIAKLVRYGLLWPPVTVRQAHVDPRLTTPEQRRRSARYRFVTRTPLGDGIVAQYAPLLREPGARIRWDARLDEAVEAVRAACPRH